MRDFFDFSLLWKDLFFIQNFDYQVNDYFLIFIQLLAQNSLFICKQREKKPE
jgi:hypothetical protein